ncbi:MAG: Ig-like domain-containing protein [Cyclobacteriaceae bacterium]|nr:Ig-like domain-containing protein [Cyclobacteriaceae bacterium HetDA_MAG_MS6]
MIRFTLGFLLIAGVSLTMSCGDDDSSPDPLTVVSITGSGTDFDTGQPVSGIDLFGATSATGVPLDLTITITFSADVDETTVSTSTISVTGGDANTVNANTAGAVVTLTFTNELDRGTDYTIAVSGISGSSGGTLGSTASVQFTSAGRGEVTPPNEGNQQIFLKLDGNANDETGNYAMANEAAIVYGADRFGQEGSAAYFDGDESIIEYTDGVNLISTDFTLSFWIYVDTVDHKDANGNLAGMFAVGMGNFNGWQLELNGGGAQFDRMKVGQRFTTSDSENPTTAEDFTVWNLDGTLEGFEENRGADFENNVSGGLQGLMVGKWAHFVYVYNSSENTRYFYINGELQRRTNFNNSTIDKIKAITGMVFGPSETQDEPSDIEFISKRLALGFVHGTDSKMWVDQPWGGYTFPGANHFKGRMDDFRVFDMAYSGSDVTSLYNDEKP